MESFKKLSEPEEIELAKQFMQSLLVYHPTDRQKVVGRVNALLKIANAEYVVEVKKQIKELETAIKNILSS